MNLFNRIFIIVLCLVFAALAIAIAALAWTIPNDTIDWLRDAVDWMGRHNQDTEKALLTIIVAVIAFLAIVLILLQLLPDNGDVKVTDLRVGGAVLSTGDITQRIEEAVRRVDHVVNVKAGVKAKRKGVLVLLDLHVDPDANLAVVTDEACEAARDVLTNKVHVALAAPPQARLHYRELRMKTRRVKEEPAGVPLATTDDDEREARPMPVAGELTRAGTPEATTPALASEEEPLVDIPEHAPLTVIADSPSASSAEERPHETTPRA